jgi:NADH:ubiquinone oxidoreductase subunit F (NADH-binding)/NADH:ubiquinone oxidoreductase subunit E
LPFVLEMKSMDSEITELTDRYDRDPEALLPILQALQARRGGLSRMAISEVARALHLPAERAYGVATFYTLLSTEPTTDSTLRWCDGPACWLRGATKIGAALEEVCGQDWIVKRTSCLGLCDRAPAALVEGQPCGPLPEQVTDINTAFQGETPTYPHPRPGETRVLLAHAGEIDSDSIDSALAHEAYHGLESALKKPPAEVLAEVETSGLTGRGGAGFPTGRKWRMVAQARQLPKYVVCNADESEPLVFKDRVLIDTHPHQLLEGMALAGYAVGAYEGFIYIRGEYEIQAARLERAIQQAEARGWLGRHIRESEFSFQIHVHRGAGAYICGEESALLESLEGKRGEPRVRPPYPTTHGYHGQPTLVNNVETLSAIPTIVLNGAEFYRNLGPQPGTKLYTLLGAVRHPGLFEAPLGLTLRQIIDDFGGGLRPGSTFNFALTGGAAGTIVPPHLLDVPIDYASGAAGVSLSPARAVARHDGGPGTHGVALGAGAFLICDQTVSVVALLRELLHFFEVESCGKCTPCRIGTRQARIILDRLLAGEAQPDEVKELAQLAEVLQTTSFCGLGQSAAIPLKSALEHFAPAFH